jgi:hypothetical protein
MSNKIIPYANSEATGTIDFWNEVTCAYLEGDFARANVAAIMFNAESVEALRLLLLEGADNFGKVMPLGADEAKKLGG